MPNQYCKTVSMASFWITFVVKSPKYPWSLIYSNNQQAYTVMAS